MFYYVMGFDNKNTLLFYIVFSIFVSENSIYHFILNPNLHFYFLFHFVKISIGFLRMLKLKVIVDKTVISKYLLVGNCDIIQLLLDFT